MSEERLLQNCVRTHRQVHGWSQDELAQRTGVSRAGISAIEQGRLVPSAATALALAGVFACHVEDIFFLEDGDAQTPQWAWPSLHDPCRFWQATVAGQRRLYPVESTSLGMLPHDGVCEGGIVREHDTTPPGQTLVIACCDPAVGLLAGEMQRHHGIRLLALQRSSRAALSLLGQGLIHAAGVHLATRGHASRNAAVAREEVKRDVLLLRIARWQEGLVAAPDKRLKSVRAAIQSHLRWVGRESGSAVAEVLGELLPRRSLPDHCASSHRGVAEAVKNGWADVGVCLQLAGDEAGLDFLSLRYEDYDLCFPAEYESDPRIQALVEVVRSSAYRTLLQGLPGYDTAKTGELHPVAGPHKQTAKRSSLE